MVGVSRKYPRVQVVGSVVEWLGRLRGESVSIIVDELLFQCGFPSPIVLHKFSSGRCGPCR
jgi:hypothetical protein